MGPPAPSGIAPSTASCESQGQGRGWLGAAVWYCQRQPKVKSQEPGVHLVLVFLESSLDSPEFPFLGGAFGATAWPYTPKQESGRCLVLCVLCYPL